MRAKTRVVSFVFCALLALEPQRRRKSFYDVTQQNNEVVQYGLTELMGEVRFLLQPFVGRPRRWALAPPSEAQSPSPTMVRQSTICQRLLKVTVNSVTYATGIELTLTGGYEAGLGTTDIVSLSAINTALGGQIILTVQGGFAVAAGDQIRINGARTDVSAKSIGSSVAALISSAPSNANTFNSVNVTVATVNRSMTVDVTGATNPICITPTNPTFRVTEGLQRLSWNTPRPVLGARTRFVPRVTHESESRLIVCLLA
jgi:hypothetical protein